VLSNRLNQNLATLKLTNLIKNKPLRENPKPLRIGAVWKHQVFALRTCCNPQFPSLFWITNATHE
jgi:hypothetical protein